MTKYSNWLISFTIKYPRRMRKDDWLEDKKALCKQELRNDDLFISFIRRRRRISVQKLATTRPSNTRPNWVTTTRRVTWSYLAHKSVWMWQKWKTINLEASSSSSPSSSSWSSSPTSNNWIISPESDLLAGDLSQLINYRTSESAYTSCASISFIQEEDDGRTDEKRACKCLLV